MAQTVATTQTLDIRLDYAFAMVAELSEVADEWDDLEEHDRTSWSLDWDQFVADHLRSFQSQHSGGAMSAEQEARYRLLLRRLEQHLPTIRRLKLWVPPTLGES
jgi:hypothetical protein